MNGFTSPAFKETFKDCYENLSLELSMLEDYTNRVYDLLSHTPANQTKAQLPVSMVNDGILSVKNLTVLSSSPNL